MLSALAIVFGFVAAYIDLHTSEVTVTVFVLLVFGFILGLSQANQAWRWAIILGIWVPIAQITARLADGSRPLGAAYLLAPLLAFVPAFAGTYLGVLTRWIAARRPAPLKG
jgi:hypothetical protein